MADWPRINTGWGGESLCIATNGTPLRGATRGKIFIDSGGPVNKEMTSPLMIKIQSEFCGGLYVNRALIV